ncbi:glycosyltransferase family 2 protein [Marinoscillum sp.]|uniref:glycosyltransferase family 2 protein n=1 Tax=Marinoscillum sp. TaxID=2024838 RepID=UPI003BAB5D9A
MRSASPSVSIIVPTYNRERLIVETLQSVLDQTYQDWECIVIDDGSEDKTVSLIEEFIKQDFRFKSYERDTEPKGAPTCRNIGIEKSQGRYIVFLDSDDLLGAECLKNRVQYFLDNPENDLLVFNTIGFKTKPGDYNLLWNKLCSDKLTSDLYRFLIGDTPWATPSTIWKRSTLVRIGGWNQKAKNWQDWDIHIRALLHGVQYKKIDSGPDCYFRCDHSEISIGKSEKKQAQLLSRAKTLSTICDLLLTSPQCNAKLLEACALQYFRISVLMIGANVNYIDFWSEVRHKKLINTFWFYFWDLYLRFRYFSETNARNPIKRLMDQTIYRLGKLHFWDRSITFKRIFLETK